MLGPAIRFNSDPGVLYAVTPFAIVVALAVAANSDTFSLVLLFVVWCHYFCRIPFILAMVGIDFQ